MTTKETGKVVFTTEQYEVVTAPDALPVRVTEQGVITMTADGYTVVNTETGQQDGEFRSMGDAMLAAVQWTGNIDAARQAASGITRVQPKMPSDIQ